MCRDRKSCGAETHRSQRETNVRAHCPDACLEIHVIHKMSVHWMGHFLIQTTVAIKSAHPVRNVGIFFAKYRAAEAFARKVAVKLSAVQRKFAAKCRSIRRSPHQFL